MALGMKVYNLAGIGTIIEEEQGDTKEREE